MIMKSDRKHLAGGAELLGDRGVFVRRTRIGPRGMIVCNDDRGTGGLKCNAENDPRIDDGSAESARSDIDPSQYLVGGIQTQYDELFPKFHCVLVPDFHAGRILQLFESTMTKGLFAALSSRLLRHRRCSEHFQLGQSRCSIKSSYLNSVFHVHYGALCFVCANICFRN